MFSRLKSLRSVALLAASLLCAVGAAGSASADMGDFLGNWVNQDLDTSGITHVVITPIGPARVSIHVFGQCHPTDCDWGVVEGHSYFSGVSSGDVIMVTGTFNAGFARKFLIFRRARGERLEFEALTEFRDNSGRQDYDMNGKLVRM